MDKQEQFSQSDLVLKNGAVYHLAINAKQLSDNIILVGDPDRVPLITENLFSSIDNDVYHRGLRTQTGTVADTKQRVSVVTTGMGTPSAEIVLGEVAALASICLDSRLPLPLSKQLNLIRVGTSGGLQSEDRTPLGTLIISSYAIGMDNTGLFYQTELASDSFSRFLERDLEEKINLNLSTNSSLKNRIKPYVSKANEDLVNALKQACEYYGYNYRVGITVSNSGFFANQGRDIFPVRASFPDIDRFFASYDTGSATRIENMEMESSYIFRFAAGMGYKAGAICPTVANRAADTFIKDSIAPVLNAATVTVKALSILN